MNITLKIDIEEVREIIVGYVLTTYPCLTIEGTDIHVSGGNYSGDDFTVEIMETTETTPEVAE